MFADHQGALTDALTDVAENSFFAFVSECDRDQFDELASAMPEEGEMERGWIVARVGFAGAFAGHVAATMPVALARSLLDAFTGTEPGAEVPEAAVRDAAGEFANMVCGTWLTRACQRRRFDLSPPQSERQAPGWQPPASPTGPEAGEVLKLVNDLPLRVELVFDQEWK